MNEYGDMIAAIITTSEEATKQNNVTANSSLRIDEIG